MERYSITGFSVGPYHVEYDHEGNVSIGIHTGASFGAGVWAEAGYSWDFNIGTDGISTSSGPYVEGGIGKGFLPVFEVYHGIGYTPEPLNSD